MREFVDGAAGVWPGNDNLPAADESWWPDDRQRVEQAALDAGRRGNRVAGCRGGTP